LLIRHSKYSAILSKYTLTGCFFGDFAHWWITHLSICTTPYTLLSLDSQRKHRRETEED